MPQLDRDIAPSRIAVCAALSAERHRRGISLEHIADLTRIPQRSLERLEAGDFESLPGDVFVRGFITAYANFLDIDPAPALDRYVSCKAVAVPQPLQVEATAQMPAADPSPVLIHESQPRKHIGVTFAVILLLIVATLTISYFLRSTDSTGDGVTMLLSALA